MGDARHCAYTPLAHIATANEIGSKYIGANDGNTFYSFLNECDIIYDNNYNNCVLMIQIVAKYYDFLFL